MVNVHLQIEEQCFEALVSQLRDDGNTVEYVCDDSGISLYAVMECKVFLTPSMRNGAVIHDPYYSKDYFRVVNELPIDYP